MGKYIVNIPDNADFVTWIIYKDKKAIEYDGKPVSEMEECKSVLLDGRDWDFDDLSIYCPITELKKLVNNKIAVGDEIESLEKKKMIVTKITKTHISVMRDDGTTVGIDVNKLKYYRKTGKHYEEISDILKFMKR